LKDKYEDRMIDENLDIDDAWKYSGNCQSIFRHC
jgi:hypothetical protein